MPDNELLDTELFRLLRNENKERDISINRLITDQLGLEKEKAIKELLDLKSEICVSQKKLECLNKEIKSSKNYKDSLVDTSQGIKTKISRPKIREAGDQRSVYECNSIDCQYYVLVQYILTVITY
ncbi:MAG TPA: hypothetical protein VIK44_12795 [Acetobacterium sp.]